MATLFLWVARFSSEIRGFRAAEGIMRAFVVSFIALLGMGSSGFAQDQTLRGVYAPPGAAPPAAAKSGKPGSFSGLDPGAIGNGPRVTIAGRAAEGQTLPSNVTPAPMSDRPGYGTAIVNGHRSIIDLSNNRIVQVMD
jgi:hypothetical protein